MARTCIGAVQQDSGPATEHYKLPQWYAQTPTSWMSQLNYAFQKLDRILYDFQLRTAVDGVPDETVEEVVQLSNSVEELLADVTELTKQIMTLTTNQSNMQESIANILSRLDVLTTNTTALDTRMTAEESRVTALEARVAKLEASTPPSE